MIVNRVCTHNCKQSLYMHIIVNKQCTRDCKQTVYKMCHEPCCTVFFSNSQLIKAIITSEQLQQLEFCTVYIFVHLPSFCLQFKINLCTFAFSKIDMPTWNYARCQYSAQQAQPRAVYFLMYIYISSVKMIHGRYYMCSVHTCQPVQMDENWMNKCKGAARRTMKRR